MKYRAKIYIHCEPNITLLSVTYTSRYGVDAFLRVAVNGLLNATGGHIEKYVDGIGWVVCEEDGK